MDPQRRRMLYSATMSSDAPRPIGIDAPRLHPLLAAGFALTLVALIAHAAAYSFLCDDAFISFRYARNLAEGHGLVFNPGHERVEGYSNFLLVMILGGLDRLGIPPETGSLAISWLATVALWGMLAGWVVRRPAPAGRSWLALAPLAMLAATRSIAVWTTSGLETRLFESLTIGATLRLITELGDPKPRHPFASLLYALAALTRPDGLLFAGVAFGVEAAVRARRGDLRPGVLLRRWSAFALIVGAHFAFRLAYYGAWLPNTYYAKVGGRTWWEAGGRYLAAFALEYAAWAWLPLAILGAAALARAREAIPALLLPALILVHVLYVAAIGGDHFEYRPLDLHIPLLFLLAYEGLKPLARAGRGIPAAVLVVLVLAGLIDLPLQSHVQFPARYLPGFPGKAVRDPERVEFLDPRHNLLHRLPGLEVAAAAHRDLLRWLSLRFIGLRQEEHAVFVREVVDEGRRLGMLVDEGVLPRDFHIATAAVGAIPYYSNLRTLDRLGLTDARVAHQPAPGPRIMAHDRSAPFEEATARGVDLWAAHDVHLIFGPGARHPLELVGKRVPFYAAALGSGHWLIAWLPQGLEPTAARTPRLAWLPDSSAAFLDTYVDEGVAALDKAVALEPGDFAAERDLGYFLFLRGDAAAALRHFEAARDRIGDDPELRLYLGSCRAELGDSSGAHRDLARALELAEEQGDVRLARLIRSALEPVP